MGLKENLLKFAGPGGWVASKILSKAKKPEVAAAFGALGGAAAATAVRPAPPTHVPAYVPLEARAAPPPPAAKMFAQPAVVFVLGVFAYLYLNLQGFKTAAQWTLISAIACVLVGIIFKEPRKALLILVLPFMIWFLTLMNMMTPANASLSTGFVLLLLLLSFDVAREKIARILEGATFVLGGVLIFWLSAWAQMLLDVPYPHVITTFFMLGWIIYVLGSKSKLKWIVIFTYAALFFIFFTVPDVFAPSNSSLRDAIDSQRIAWVKMFESTAMFGKQLGKGLTLQYYMGFTDFEEGVEAQSKEPLGVFLEDISVTSREVLQTAMVDVLATLRTKSFKIEQPLEIKLKCYEEGFEKDPKKQGKIEPKTTFKIEEYQSRDLVCKIPADALGVGSHRIAVEATFDFVTSGFLKSYFMEQDRAQAIRKQIGDPQVNVLTAFGITETKPRAVFTGGPLFIGMGAGDQPISLVATEPEFGPALTLTLNKNWLDGELIEISKIVVTVPPGLEMRELSNCRETAQQEQECIIDGEALKDMLGPEKPVPLPKNVRFSTSVKPDGIETILANSPMAIRSFKVGVTYTYRIKKLADVTVRGIA